jgi:hypothetical protein
VTWRCICGYTNAITSQTQLVVAHCSGCHNLHPAVEQLLNDQAMMLALAIADAIAHGEAVSYD